jgi:hypothetical protein
VLAFLESIFQQGNIRPEPRRIVNPCFLSGSECRQHLVAHGGHETRVEYTSKLSHETALDDQVDEVVGKGPQRHLSVECQQLAIRMGVSGWGFSCLLKVLHRIHEEFSAEDICRRGRRRAYCLVCHVPRGVKKVDVECHGI